MALIKCPECGREISSFASACINCGYPINEAAEEPQQIQTHTEKVKRTPLARKRNAVVAACIVVALLIGYFCLFYLGESERYTYNLVLANINNFKKSVLAHGA